MNYVYDNAKTRADQELAIQALRDKCDILWAQLDALYFAYVQPGWPPPGAFQMEAAKMARESSIRFVIPTGAQRRGGTCFCLQRHSSLTLSTPLGRHR